MIPSVLEEQMAIFIGCAWNYWTSFSSHKNIENYVKCKVYLMFVQPSNCHPDIFCLDGVVGDEMFCFFRRKKIILFKEMLNSLKENLRPCTEKQKTYPFNIDLQLIWNYFMFCVLLHNVNRCYKCWTCAEPER